MLQNIRMLILDSDSLIRKSVIANIPSHIQYDETSSVEEAISLYRAHKYHLVCLDLKNHIGSGFELIDEINQFSLARRPRIIVLTEMNSEFMEAKCHQLKITEFIHKPMRPTVFRSLIEKNIQSIESEFSDLKIVGPLQIYRRKGQVKISNFPKDEDMLLTSKEFNLLVMFLENPGRAISREKLFSTIWGASESVQSRTVDMHVSALRKKLGRYGDAINSVRGSGYSFSMKKLTEVAA